MGQRCAGRAHFFFRVFPFYKFLVSMAGFLGRFAQRTVHSARKVAFDFCKNGQRMSSSAQPNAGLGNGPKFLIAAAGITGVCKVTLNMFDSILNFAFQ
jgi:hypothetical protein